jgi:hypothetical protein
MKRFLLRGTTALVWASTVALGAAVPAHADGGLYGAVGGIQDPASGTLTLHVEARDPQGSLADVTLTVDGALVDTKPLCACQSAAADLKLDTTGYGDGVHHLTITIRDSDGHSAMPENRDFEILNHPPKGSPTATLNIGSGGATPLPNVNGSGGSGGVEGVSATSCRSPKLSMFLTQKPLRVSNGVPVLLKGKRYRFTGRLTCVVNGKRLSAAARSRIDVLNVVKGKTVRKGGATVRSKGKITLILAYPSSRAIEFRYSNSDGKTSKVRIRVIVSKNRKG